MPSVLVTGADGFVGATLCDALQMTGLSVIEAVRKRDRLFVTRNRCGDTGRRVRIEIGDIAQQGEWKGLCDSIFSVVHLAARVHIDERPSERALDEYRAVNVDGTLRLAHGACRAGVKRLVLVSSAHVNGHLTETGAFTERDVPRPGTPYAVSKLEAENELHRMAGEEGLEVVVVRPPLVYGPGVKTNFRRLLRAVARGVPLPLAGVRNLRSLIGVENLCDALLRCVLDPRAAGQTFLVSDGEDISTPDLIRRLAAMLGKPARLFPFPEALLRRALRALGRAGLASSLLDSLVVDSSKIRTVLGWKPPRTLDEGLEATARWYLHAGAEGTCA